MRHLPGILALACLTTASVAPRCLTAQSSPLVLEVRGGTSVAVGGFRTGTRVGEGAGSGASLSVDFLLSGSGRRSTYLGFTQSRFSCTAAGCPSSDPFVATGLTGGFRWGLCTRCQVSPWLQLGGLTTRVESPGVTGSAPGVSRLAFGGEVGFGVYLGAWNSVAPELGIRFAAVNTRLPEASIVRMRYTVIDVGLALAF